MAPDQDEILRQYRLWLLKVASGLLGPARRDQWHDLAQEGWIAMWRALSTYDPSLGALPPWLTTAAKLRMRDCVRRDLWTGLPPRYGHHKVAATETPVDWDAEDQPHDQLLYADSAQSIELAYHHGEILDAVNRLTPRQREYIYRRFWRDESHSKIIKEIGNGWVAARLTLRQLLAHLDLAPPAAPPPSAPVCAGDVSSARVAPARQR